MKYYFRIHTGDSVNSGTSSDITAVLYGEKGRTEAKSLRAFASGKPFQRNHTDTFAVDYQFDAGLINKLTLKKDAELYLLNGWLCDYILVSKEPFDNIQSQCSTFQINDWLKLPGSSGTYDVSEGYPYTMPPPVSRIEEFTTGTITVPQNTIYNKTVSSVLTIGVDHSTIKTTDISTGRDITLSESALTAVFSEHINQSITDTTSITLNKTEEYSDTISIGPFDTDMIYDVLWNKMIYTFDVLMGEVHFTFEVPYKESFAGLREVDGQNRLKACYLKADKKELPLFTSLGIALTRRCNASCRMCCFECGMDKDETLTETQVSDLIEQASQIEGINRVGFSGGEALLCPDLLFTGLSKAKAMGMTTSVTTNGFWGADEFQCKRTLNTLKNLELDSLTVSVDQYHLEYVPLQAVTNILKYNREFGVPFTLAVGDSLEGRRARDIISELDCALYSVDLIVYPFMPVGRGIHIPEEAIHRIPYDPKWQCNNGRHLAVLYDGTVYPCCSQAVYDSRLSLGNIKDRSLIDMAKEYSNQCIFSTLKRKGFDWFVQIADKKLGMTLPEEYHSPCHLCHILFTDDAFVDKLDSYVKEEYQQTIHEFLES